MSICLYFVTYINVSIELSIYFYQTITTSIYLSIYSTITPSIFKTLAPSLPYPIRSTHILQAFSLFISIFPMWRISMDNRVYYQYHSISLSIYDQHLLSISFGYFFEIITCAICFESRTKQVLRGVVDAQCSAS